MKVYELICHYNSIKSTDCHGIYRAFSSAHNAMVRLVRRLEREHAPFNHGTRVEKFDDNHATWAILWTLDENGVESRAVTLFIMERKLR